MASRLGNPQPQAEASDRKPCEACRLPPQEKRLHWFYSFGSTEKLFEHLAREAVPTTEAFRCAVAAWYAACAALAREKELDERRYASAGDHRRRWSLYVREASTPDEVEAIAAEMLEPSGIAAVKSVCAMWRTGGKVSFGSVDELVREVPREIYP